MDVNNWITLITMWPGLKIISEGGDFGLPRLFRPPRDKNTMNYSYSYSLGELNADLSTPHLHTQSQDLT